MRMPPTITTTRGGKRVTSCEDTPAPTLTATAKGMKPTLARSAL
ncbi:Uncharacterised protein [Mycobacterium tuberculosis]|nr:Uncharacterised protein [Mycobacterium tuberculosis]